MLVRPKAPDRRTPTPRLDLHQQSGSPAAHAVPDAVLGISFMDLPRGRQTPLGGLTLCVGLAPKKNPPTVRAVGGLGFCPVRGTHTKSASFKDSAVRLTLRYGISRLRSVCDRRRPSFDLSASPSLPSFSWLSPSWALSSGISWLTFWLSYQPCSSA